MNRTSSAPLWENIEKLRNNQGLILEKLEKTSRNIEFLDTLLAEILDIAAKADKIIENINKININRLEETLIRLDEKIPHIDSLIERLNNVIQLVNQIGNELGING